MAAIYSSEDQLSHHINNLQTASQLEDRKRLLCRFHMRGSCRDGEWCQFSHNSDQSVCIPDTVCWYYLHSHCMYGDNCRFVHCDASALLAATNTTNRADRPDNQTSRSISSLPNPSLTDSRQSSEDSGYSEPTVSLGTGQKSVAPLAPLAQPKPTLASVCKTYAQMASNKDSVKGVSLVKTVASNAINASSGSLISQSKQLCPYASDSIDGICPYPEGQCNYTHGLICDYCGRSCLDPNNLDQQNKHRDECIREHEREMEISFAVQRSLDKACGICMDIVIEKEPVTERRFGILEKCSHIFCLSCIRKWRQTKQFDNRTIRSCPECRVSSDFVIPSKYWYDERSEKDQLIVSYKKALSTKPCKYFKQGQGECPFAGACFYLHAYPDGRRAEMPPPRQRRRQNHEGELETLRVLIGILINPYY